MSSSRSSIIRLGKSALVLTTAVLTSLVVLNNVTDYQSNFVFVSHVLSMDTTFPDNNGLWRRIEAPLVHHGAYVSIILVQCLIASLTWIGGLRMLVARADSAHFASSTGYAVLGLTAGVVLYVAGFLAIGGEWFLMWQSRSWNAQDAAMRFALVFALVLLVVMQADRDES